MRNSARRERRATDEAVLAKAIALSRDHAFPRGELICSGELAKIALARGDRLLAARHAGHAGLIFLRTEFRGGPRQITGKVLTSLRLAKGFLVPHRRARTDAGPIHCPCGADHTVR